MTCFLGHRFCIDFGGVWGGVWDPKIVAFRIFFDVFSMSKSKCVLEREKIDSKFEKSKLFRFLAPGLRCRGGPGEREKERGVRILAEEFRRRISRSYRRCRLTIQHEISVRPDLVRKSWFAKVGSQNSLQEIVRDHLCL